MSEIQPADMAQHAQVLVDQYRRQPAQTPETIKDLVGYWEFIEGAEAAGFTGSDLEGDQQFASRSPEWIAAASTAQLQSWTHTVLRAERWSGEWPTAILEALQGGQLEALAARLREQHG